MENSYHLNFFGRKLVENRERKTANNSTPQGSVNDWVLVGISNYTRQRFVDALHELSIEILALNERTIGGLQRVRRRLRE